MKKGVVILIEKDGKLLFMQEPHGDFAGFWSMPKGVVLDDETPEQTIVRKAKSETGFNVKPLKKVFEEKADTKVDVVEFWETKVLSGELEINHNDALAYEWLTPKEALDKRLIPATESFLKNWNNDEK